MQENNANQNDHQPSQDDTTNTKDYIKIINENGELDVDKPAPKIKNRLFAGKDSGKPIILATILLYLALSIPGQAAALYSGIATEFDPHPGLRLGFLMLWGIACLILAIVFILLLIFSIRNYVKGCREVKDLKKKSNEAELHAINMSIKTLAVVGTFITLFVVIFNLACIADALHP